jgi:hypothetical protein
LLNYISKWWLCKGTGEDKQDVKELESAMKYWLRVLETNVTNVLGDTLGQQMLDRENN